MRVREREGDGERRRNIDRGRVCVGRERVRDIRDEEKGSQRESEGIRGERERERVRECEG